MPHHTKASTFGRIRRFVRGEGVRIVFQPITDLATGRVVGFESLARFEGTPARSTAAWFDEAQAAGLRRDLELATARAAVRALDEIPQEAYLSINASPDVAMDPSFIAVIPSSGGERLVVEITEHTPVEDYDSLNGALDILRSRGVRVAIDDAGAGFANMTHILRIAPDLIKLDVELTRHVDIDSRRRALVRSLVAFARSCGATLVAEGIETEAELLALRSLGVTAGQGYYLGYPAALPGVTPVETRIGRSASFAAAASDARMYLRSRRASRRAAKRPRSVVRPIALALLGAVILGPATMAVADDAMPGSAAYWLKRRVESVRIFVAFDGETRLRLHLEFAQRRMNELSEMLADGRSDLASGILVDYRGQMDAVAQALGNSAAFSAGLRKRIESDVAEYVAALDGERTLLCGPHKNAASCESVDLALGQSRGAIARIQHGVAGAQSHRPDAAKKSRPAKPRVATTPDPAQTKQPPGLLRRITKGASAH